MQSWGDGKVTVDAIQEANKVTPGGYERTRFIMDVQAATGSKVDGKAGRETIGNTVTVSASKNRKHPVVVPLQKRLNALGHNCGAVDGIAGAKFTAAVNSYQKNVLGYRNLDGEITAGKKMWKSLLGMV
ncbi:peptidoglycan-binding domain-containing protein [Lachnospiraceae bacterium 29-84]